MPHVAPMRMALVASALLVCAVSAAPVATNPTVSFERDVRPILKTYCFHCHGEQAELKGDLDVRLKRLMIKGGEHGAEIVPGSPEKSRLLQMIKSGKMPKTEKKPKAEQVAIIEKWIAAGAPTLRA